MRVLICGVIGAVVAATAWLGLEFFLQKDIGWLAIAVGLVTGLSVHKGAGSVTGGGYARGAFAALLALAAIVGGRQAYAKVMEAVNNSAAPIAVVTGTVEEADDDTSSKVATSEETVPEVEVETISLISLAEKVSMRKQFSLMEMIWMCSAALIAYVTGKGPDVVAVEEEQAEGQTDEPPQAQDGSDE